MVDLTGAFGLKQACEKLGKTEAEVRKFIKDHPSLAPQRFESLWVCDADWLDTVRTAMNHISEGLCLHCGKPAFSLDTEPKPEPTTEPPAEAAE